MTSRLTLLILGGIACVLISLPFWFVALMAVIAGRAWSLGFVLIGLILLGLAGLLFYMAYSSGAESKMAAAREHNMERQVVAVSKRKSGFVTVTDLVAVGFGEEDANYILDHLAKKGLCSINLDATKYSGVKTYVFPLDVKIRCKYCGTPLDPGMTRCPSCGAPVELTNVRPKDDGAKQ